MSERTFPIMGGPSIPWSLIAPHELQAIANHDQTLTRLAERGGLSPCEAVAVLEDRKWKRMPDSESLARLIEIRDKSWQARALKAEAELKAIQLNYGLLKAASTLEIKAKKMDEAERDAIKKILTFSVNDWTPEQLAEEGLCAKCTHSMSSRDGSKLEPGDICDNCAQELIHALRAEIGKGK